MQQHELAPLLKRITATWRPPMNVNADAELAEYGKFLSPFRADEIDAALDWLKTHREKRDWPAIAEIRAAVTHASGKTSNAYTGPIPIALAPGVTEDDVRPIKDLLDRIDPDIRASPREIFKDSILLEVTPDKGFDRRPFIRLGFKTSFRADWARSNYEGPWNEALNADIRFVVA